jgi:hypothetical protein
MRASVPACTQRGAAGTGTVASLFLGTAAVLLAAAMLSWPLAQMVRAERWGMSGAALLAHRIQMDSWHSSGSMAFPCASRECLVMPVSPSVGPAGIGWQEAVAYRNSQDGVQTTRMTWNWQAGPPCDPDDGLCQDWPEAWTTVAPDVRVQAFRDPGGSLVVSLSRGGTVIHESALDPVNP